MTHDPGIVTAADYADAMMTARRAKNIILLLLLLVLLAQIAIFFIVKYTNVLVTAPALSTATTQPAFMSPATMNFLTNACMFLALVLSIVLGFILLLIVNIMLIGRLIGVARVTSAYIWSLILLFLLFPWQFFLDNVGLTMQQIAWKIPGVLWTWSELARDAKFSNDPFFPNAFIHWARFVGMPLVALIIVLAIRIKSTRGIRQALGEDAMVPVVHNETGI